MVVATLVLVLLAEGDRRSNQQQRHLLVLQTTVLPWKLFGQIGVVRAVGDVTRKGLERQPWSQVLAMARDIVDDCLYLSICQPNPATDFANDCRDVLNGLAQVSLRQLRRPRRRVPVVYDGCDIGGGTTRVVVDVGRANAGQLMAWEGGLVEGRAEREV